MSVHRFCYPDAVQAAEACSHHIQARLEEALSGRPIASLAISGGASPRPVFEQLASSGIAWDRVHLFWVDERAVPPGDPQSNFGMAEQWLTRPTRIPKRNLHRIAGELRPDEAARRYSADIQSFFGLALGEMPHFDVIHRGIGADGHTASLFPGEPLLEDRENLCAAVWVEKLGQWRITLLPGVLLAARHTVFYATGEEKGEVVRAILEEPYDPKKYPAQMVSHHGRGVAWFLDAAAARLLG